MRIHHILVGLSLLVYSFSASAQTVSRVKVTDLEQIIREGTGPMIINFWATWCKPCLEELPYFQEEAAKFEKDGLQLFLVSMDFEEAYPVALTTFIKKRGIRETVVWLDETNADYFCPRIDSSWSGSIPATLFINNSLARRSFFEEQISHSILKKQIQWILGKD